MKATLKSNEVSFSDIPNGGFAVVTSGWCWHKGDLVQRVGDRVNRLNQPVNNSWNPIDQDCNKVRVLGPEEVSALTATVNTVAEPRLKFSDMKLHSYAICLTADLGYKVGDVLYRTADTVSNLSDPGYDFATREDIEVRLPVAGEVFTVTF